MTPAAMRRMRTAATAALQPLDQWAQKCHTASLELVRLEVFPNARVARGTCRGVGSQHSWVVVGPAMDYDADAATAGPDPYSLKAQIVDPTLWSYDQTVSGVWVGTAGDGRHIPMGGLGSIWQWGKPAPPREAPVQLTPTRPFSVWAQTFLKMLGPLDRDGWCLLMKAPMRGWPAGEIVAAMDDTPELSALVPIDLLGMLTDRNPDGLYLPGAAQKVPA